MVLLLTGCLDPNGQGPYIRATKIGPGQCVEPGLVATSLRAFHPGPNASIEVEITNLNEQLLFGIYGVSIGADEPIWAYGNLSINGIRVTAIEPNETAILTATLSEVPEGEWAFFYIPFGVSNGSGHNGRPIRFNCSLDGDNAPWAFANTTAQA